VKPKRNSHHGTFDKRKKKYENGDELPYTGPWKNGEKVSFNEDSGKSSASIIVSTRQS